MGVRLSVAEERFPVAGAFTISRGSRTEIRVVTATLSDGGFSGRGECVPYPRYGETAESVIALIRSVAIDLDNGLDRLALQDRLPPGAARNALDCAFWDLEAKRTATPVWRLAGLAEPQPAPTAYTISLAAPEAMREKAAQNADRPLLKIKLGSDGDLQRIQAVRAGAPNAKLFVDANEGWTLAQYQALAPEFARLGVALVEQPLPAANDAALATIARPLAVCADESCHGLESLPRLARKYDAINIKLDKTGGLTAALRLKRQAAAEGFRIMIGCMLGTSLAMAPAFLLTGGVDFIDLDGPLLLAKDRETPIRYAGSLMFPAAPALWG
jgi:L-alanine-DL-glutamate epimerase-like enolase superfamily enzyme